MTESPRHFVDLFAGCGGLSLGLEDAGFAPAFVSELNKDALETYLTNRADRHPLLLHEEFHGNDIKELVVRKGAIARLSANIASAYGIDARAGELDLVVGGPPCQGFSGIGHRRSYSVSKEQMPSNHLFEDMVYVVSKLRPKVFLFENVRGLLSARWTPAGTKGEIWKDVQKTFAEQLPDYVIRWELVHAKDYGVPQNRPRVLMVGVRGDIGHRLELDDHKRAGGLLPQPIGVPPDLVDVLGDLVDPTFNQGGLASTDQYPSEATSSIQKYFRRDPDSGRILPRGAPLTEHEYSRHSPRVVAKFVHMLENDGVIPAEYRTKKFAQRALPPRWGTTGPTITATSLPDDYVHYAQPRSLTVREWARLQTFPDWYSFAGKRTTGGVRRAGNPREGIFDRELPKYTQIGNAVPVLMGRAVGEHLLKILSGRLNVVA